MGISYGTRTPKSLSSEIFSMKVADRQTDKPVGGLACAGAKL